MTVYPSRVDWWVPPLLALPFLGSGAVVAMGGMYGDALIYLSGLCGVGLYVLALFGLVYPVRYVVSDVCLEIRFGLVQIRIPWNRVIDMVPSANPLSAPALSLRRLNVRYFKASGKERTIRISPPDRAAFVADCARASQRHRADCETLDIY